MRTKFDVFISYAHSDEEAVRRLVVELERRGLSVYIDHTEIADFEGITQSVEHGLQRSKALLAYYSKRYPTRRACQWELTAAFVAAQRDGDPRRRVLIVNPEAGTGHIEPVELRDAKFRAAPVAGDEQALVALSRSVAEHVAKIDGTLGEVTSVVSPLWHPGQRGGSARFVGRVPDMWAIHSALHESEFEMLTGVVGAVAQLRGLGGVGKSLLAEEYALRFAEAYPGGIFWLRGYGDGEGSLEAVQREAERARQLQTFAARLGITLASSKPSEVRGELGCWLAVRGAPALWVVDDLPSDLNGELEEWLAPHPSAKTLITTRSREYDALGRRIDLGELPAEEALELLTKRQPARSEEDGIAARAIVSRLGHHALALDVAGAALRFQAFSTLLAALDVPSDDWLDRLAEGLKDALPNGHERSIARTLSRSISRLDGEGMDFLRLASVLAPAPVSADLITAVFGSIDGLDELHAAERQLKAVAQVESLSLADSVGQLAWQVHTLVSRTVQFTDEATDRRAALREAAVRSVGVQLEDLRRVLPRPGAEALVAHARELSQEPSNPDELVLLGQVGTFDHERGDYVSAELLLGQACEVSEQMLGAEHPITLSQLNNFAETLRARGDLTRAQAVHERVAESRRKVLGEDDARSLTSRNNLALTLAAEGDLETARVLLDDVLASRCKVLGEDNPDTLASLNNLADVIRAQGDMAQAQALNERAVHIRRQAPDGEDPALGVALNNLAAVLRDRGDFVRARTVHEEAIALLTKLQGEEHPDTLTAISNLGATLWTEGDLGGAEVQYQRALKGRRKALGETHPATLDTLSNLSAVLLAQHQLAAVRELVASAVETTPDLLSGTSTSILDLTSTLAATLVAQGDFAEAREVLEREIATRERVLGATDPSLITALQGLAKTYWQEGDVTAARRVIERTLQAQQNVLGEGHPDTLPTLANLAAALRAEGDLAGARRLLERAVEVSQRVLGDDHPRTQTIIRYLSEVRSSERP